MSLTTIEMTFIGIMWIMMYTMSMKKKNSPKTMSPFECGYNSLFSKLPMSIQFTLLVFIFLLFDIELSILISSNWKITIMDKNWIMMISAFMASMMLSISYEMMKKSIMWT